VSRRPEVVRVAVAGASGYMGAELLRLLSVHPKIELTGVTSDRLAGEPIGKAYPHLRGLNDFLLRPGRTGGSLCVGRRNHFAFEQLLLTLCIVAQKFQLRRLRVGIANGGVNLRSGEIAARLQFGCIQLHNRLARV